jgi:hypothetical protein
MAGHGAAMDSTLKDKAVARKRLVTLRAANMDGVVPLIVARTPRAVAPAVQ